MTQETYEKINLQTGKSVLTVFDAELIAGLDLGKLSDPSAFALCRRTRPAVAKAELQIVDGGGMGAQKVVQRQPFTGQLTREERRRRQWNYRLAKMQRWDVGTSYESILEWLVKAYSKPPELGGLAGTTLAVDYTGVGVAVVEWLQKELKLAKAKAVIRPIWIQSGRAVNENSAGGWNVPKKELVSVLQVLMGTDRLTIEQQMKNCGNLVKELKNFKVKQNLETGNESFEAWRDHEHDDMVLALAILLWVGEQANRDFWVR